jgi:hypothetical protein
MFTFIVTRLRAGRPAFDSREENGIFLFATASRPTLRPTHPLIQSVPGAKRPVRETDHSPLSSAEVRNASIYTLTQPCVFIAWYFVQHRDFTFFFNWLLQSLSDLGLP